MHGSVRRQQVLIHSHQAWGTHASATGHTVDGDRTESAVLPLLLLQADLYLNSNRAGYLALAIVPFSLSSTGKNSAMALLTGISPVRLNFVHRILGLAIALLATVHMTCMMSNWANFSSYLQEELTMVQSGLAGYVCLCIVVLGSIAPVRRRAYEVFLTTHILVFVFLATIIMHTSYAMPYFTAGFFCYAINLIFTWLVQSRIACVRLEPLEQCTRLTLRLSSVVYHSPGQYLYVCIPAISPFQWHPFTITNSEQNDTLEVHAFVRGNFTRRLYHKADSNEWPAFVSGPFGTHDVQLLPHTLLLEHDTIALMTAGAGVTFGLRLLRELATKCGKFTGNTTRNIYFCWSVRSQADLRWLREELDEKMVMFDEAHKCDIKQPQLHVQLYVTRVEAAAEDIKEKRPVESEVKPGRLDANKFLSEHASARLGLFGKLYNFFFGLI